MSAALAEHLDAWLPQTQCTRCGYPRCRDYAEALACGGADIDRCPPGGEETIRALAAILGVPAKPLNPLLGPHEPRKRARIDETRCIGCAKCLDACPVDAILGSRRLMHAVLERECTGCGLCVPPCPVDCIALLPAAPPAAGAGPWPDYTLEETARWRVRAERHFERLARRAQEQSGPRAVRTVDMSNPEAARRRIRAEIRAAVERVKRRRGLLANEEPDRIHGARED